MNGGIHSPQGYQEQLIDQALGQNTIISLDQGLSKLETTLRVINRFRNLFPQKKSIILVDPDALDWDLYSFTGFTVGVWTPRQDFYPKTCQEAFKEIWNSNDILLMYGESLFTLLQENLIALSDLCVIVFDECLAALTHKNSYAKIMAEFYEGAAGTRILGFAKSINHVDLALLEDILKAKVCDFTGNESNANGAVDGCTRLNCGVSRSAISRLSVEGAFQLVYWYLAMSRSRTVENPFQKVLLAELGSAEVFKILSATEYDLITGLDLSMNPFSVYSCNFFFNGKPKTIYGGFEDTIEEAKFSAALETCKFLRENGALDRYLLPVVDNTLFYETKDLVDTAVVDFVEKLVPEPFCRFEENHNQFYLTILDIGSNQDNSVFKVPFVAIATPASINVDCIPLIPLWISKRKLVNVKLIRYSEAPMTFTASQLGTLKSCQPIFWNFVFQGLDEKFKTAFEDDANLSFYVLPMYLENNVGAVDWELMETQHVHITLHTFLSKFATLYDGTASLNNVNFSGVFRLEENPSILAENIVDTEFLKFLRRALSELDMSCLEYLYTDLEIDLNLCKDGRVNSEIKTPMDVFYGSRGFEFIHPVLFAIVGNRRRSLKQHRFNPKYFKDSFQNFLLDTCYLVPLPTSFLDQLHLLPTVVTVIDMHSTVDQFYLDFNPIRISREIIFPAFLAPAVNYGVDYQRLESLGDSVLKLATTTFFYQYYHKDEHFITKSRGHILTNTNLYIIARRFGLEKYLVTQKPTLNTFAPPFMVRNKPSTPSFVSVKTLADFMEALIGAYFEYDYNLSWDFMEHFGVVPGQASVWNMISKHPSHILHFYYDYSELDPLERTLGYKFKSPGLLSIALTLPEYDCVSYQRLECLGDAVLEAMVMKYFYLEYPTANPAELHVLKTHSVNAEIFNRISYSLGLHNYVRGTFAESYEAYFEYLERLTPFDLPTLTEIDGPKVLGDLFEAAVGAIFVDLCGNLDLTWMVVKKLLDPFLELYATFDSVTLSPISEFYMAMTSLGLDRHSMLLTEEFRSTFLENGEIGKECTLNINQEVLAIGTGNTRRLAKHNAYQIASDQVKTFFERPRSQYKSNSS